ncbi:MULTISPECIES: BolA family protein [Oceanimonas]|uniref:BolA family protein n=1 Tax=Oceanimonas smirnovii TaxID=264574 RepID=A0ABW7P1T7_9GAMM|nr:BolA family protein [Oceanimonas sp. CAM02]MDV2857993.1 BolA family protein [Oceanimonas sp. CAM02]
MDLKNEVERRLRDALELDELHVKNDGDHFQVIAVADMFAEMSRVKRQQAINGPLMDLIAQNAIHALSVKTFTPEQWARERKFIMPS